MTKVNSAARHQQHQWPAPPVCAIVMGNIKFKVSNSFLWLHRCNESVEKAGGMKIMSNMLVIFVGMISFFFH